MSDAIELAGVRVAFGGRQVLDAVSYTVPWGSVTGFVGVNGAGKTTTLRALLGLERGAGVARIAGRPYPELERPLRTLGYCPDALRAAPGRTARQHLRPLAIRAGVDRAATERVLAEVGLERARGRVRTFSLGMRRRLAVAGALLATPRVLVLDEPFEGLDPAGRRWLASRLLQHAEAGGAVLLSAHALDEIEQLIDRVVCLHDGSVRFEGSTDAFLRAHAAPVVLVRSTDQRALGAALRAAGATVHGRAGGALAVRGLSAVQIAHVARTTEALVTELTPRRLSLSAAFAAATSEAS